MLNLKEVSYYLSVLLCRIKYCAWIHFSLHTCQTMMLNWTFQPMQVLSSVGLISQLTNHWNSSQQLCYMWWDIIRLEFFQSKKKKTFPTLFLTLANYYVTLYIQILLFFQSDTAQPSMQRDPYQMKSIVWVPSPSQPTLSSVLCSLAAEIEYRVIFLVKSSILRGKFAIINL